MFGWNTKYKAIYKERGIKGLMKEGGRKLVIVLFLFFLIKGLIWLAVFWGLFEFVKQGF